MTAENSPSPLVLVTGAGKGIGKAIALDAAKAGYDIAIHYGRDRQGAQDTLKSVQDLGRKGHLLSFDLADREACRLALEADIAEHGTYYGVVLNAGIARDNAFPALEDEDWDQVIRTNLDGFYNVLKPLVMPLVRTRKPGRIITISSLSGLTGNRGQVNYSASKAGIIGATKALALELAKRQITVNCVAPGVIETQMIDHIPQEEIKKMIPLRRFGRPEEVAATVTFLLSKSAGYITRQVISVNGGMV
ncbi:MAG: 3-oxoacyl-ACP reductase FabG [Alphaproteobacteria bacterium]|nr:3-oxoacyl-ACP reductase FabG [Alphaproteobacteria bacterium]NCQ67088.1 3-oxoacyl-ACP reductase FabG [Alphaproteobacteria bacterium]NCT07685.1 3-oxoacyl-ACP reductase FabG [Alphaproteobacteria bacterium]